MANAEAGADGTVSTHRDEVQWHLARDGRQYGPLSIAEIAKLVELGHLKDADLVWRAGFADWRPLGEVRHEIVPAAPTPFAQAAAVMDPRPTADPTRLGSGHSMMPGAASETQPTWQKRLEALAMRDFDAPADATGTVAATGTRPAQQTVDRAAGPRGAGPVAPSDLRQNDSRQIDPRQSHMRHADPRHADPRHADPRLADLQHSAQRPMEATSVDPRTRRDGGMPVPMPNERRAPPEGHRRPAPSEQQPLPDLHADDGEDGDEPPTRSPVLKVTIALVLLALIGAGTGYAYMNRAMLLDMFNQQIGGAETPAGGVRHSRISNNTTNNRSALGNQPPPERAAAPATAALAKDNVVPSAPAVAAASSTGLLATPLWSSISAQFPDWANAQQAEVEKLRARQVPDDTIDGRLIQAIVDLRRRNADDALAAPEEHVLAVADAFVVNLKVLKAKSIEACYGFISRGETSPVVLPSIGRESGVTEPILAQLNAVVVAIGAGKKQPVAYVQPFASDYTSLTDELVKRGWSRDDLELFSNPQALSKATPEQVCRLVMGWFEAQLGIATPEIKMRLLRQSLRPVVSG